MEQYLRLSWNALIYLLTNYRAEPELLYGIHHFGTLQPKTYTLNPKPSSLNTQLSTLKPNPQTRNPEPQTQNPKP